jgi:Predicted integral membrane protein
MIENGFMYLASLVLFAGIVSTLEMKYKDVTFFKYVPTPVILYVGCMLFATFDLWASNDAIKDTYRTVRGHLIPAMIFVMLLRCDIRKILKLGPRMLLGFFCATFTIMTGFYRDVLLHEERLSCGWVENLGRACRQLDRRHRQYGGDPRRSRHQRLRYGVHASGG